MEYLIKSLALAKQELVELVKYYYRDRNVGRVSSFAEYDSKEYIHEKISKIAPHFKRLNHAYKVLYRRTRGHDLEAQPLDVFIYVVKTASHLEIWHVTDRDNGDIDPDDVLLDPDNSPHYRRYLAHKFTL